MSKINDSINKYKAIAAAIADTLNNPTQKDWTTQEIADNVLAAYSKIETGAEHIEMLAEKLADFAKGDCPFISGSNSVFAYIFDEDGFGYSIWQDEEDFDEDAISDFTTLRMDWYQRIKSAQDTL